MGVNSWPTDYNFQMFLLRISKILTLACQLTYIKLHSFYQLGLQTGSYLPRYSCERSSVEISSGLYTVRIVMTLYNAKSVTNESPSSPALFKISRASSNILKWIPCMYCPLIHFILSPYFGSLRCTVDISPVFFISR